MSAVGSGEVRVKRRRAGHAILTAVNTLGTVTTTMYEHIMVPTDGSDAAVAAGKAAFALGQLFDSTLHAVHVRKGDDDDRATALVEAIAEAAEEVDRPTTTAVLDREESIPAALVAYAADNDVDCIVMGTHGRKGLRESVLGSVTERTLRDAPVPVVTVHEETAVTADIDQLLVPTDGSERATAAVDHAVEFAAATGAAVQFVHVVESTGTGAEIHDDLEAVGQEALDDARTRARAADISDIEATLATGRPHQAIQEYVDSSDVDYVVMGTHGRSGASSVFIGSVTERVIRLVDVPVVAVSASSTD